MNTFAAKYDVKYPKAVACLTKDRDALLAFYDFPAEHWRHIRTTNPIESVFATVRHRTVRTKSCLSHGTTLAMVFKLITTASKTWRRLMGKQSVAQGHRRCEIQRRYAGRRNQNSRRRLITPSPKIGHNSCGVHAGKADTVDAPLRGRQAVGKTGIVAQGLRNGRIGA